MSGVTVSALTRMSGLSLVGQPPNKALERHVQNVNVMDLADPARYLLPNEFVLTNGLWLEQTSAHDWVARVAQAGASALGVGLGDAVPVAPQELLDACEAQGLPLVLVAADVSFASIAEAVAATLADDTARALRRQLAAARNLLRAAVDEHAYVALATQIHRETGLSAAFVSAHGDILSAIGTRPRARDIIEASTAFREHRLPASAGNGSAFPVPNTSGRGSLLLIGSPIHELADSTRLAIEQAAAYAVVADQRRFEHQSVLDALTAEVIELLGTGDLGEQQLKARLITLGFARPTELTVVVGEDRPALRNALNAVEGTAALAIGAGVIEAFLQADAVDELIDSTAALVRFWGDEPRFGHATGAATVRDLRIALAVARAAFRRAETDSLGPTAGTTETTNVLLTAIDPALRKAHADNLLSAVLEWDRKHGGDLVSTLRAFLDNDGRFRETASTLGIHVNTLKHRLARIKTLTGRDVDRTADRVDLWIALSADSHRCH